MHDSAVFKFYQSQGISESVLRELARELSIPKREVSLSKYAQPIRLEMVKEAIDWAKGPSQANRKTQSLYYIGNYYVGVEKPGKEAAADYKRCTDYLTKEKTNNPNDMLPVIYFNNSKKEKNFNFMEIFQGIELLMHSDLVALEVLGMVLFRMAFVLDHKRDSEGNYRLDMSPSVMEFLKKRIPDILGVSVEACIYYLETLALNEDVKYFTLHNNPELKKDAGRVNTLSTLVNLIAVLLNRKSLAEFAGNFARVPAGIAPIQKTKISDYFPLLSS